MTDQLPAIIQPGALTTATDTYIVPALIADAGDAAGWRYVAKAMTGMDSRRTSGMLETLF